MVPKPRLRSISSRQQRLKVAYDPTIPRLYGDLHTYKKYTGSKMGPAFFRNEAEVGPECVRNGPTLASSMNVSEMGQRLLHQSNM